MASPDSFRKDFTHLPILLFQRNEGMAKHNSINCQFGRDLVHRLAFYPSGVIGLVTTFWARHIPGFWWSLVSALLGILVGAVLIAHRSNDLYGGLMGWPLETIGPLRMVLVLFFLIEGGASIMFALEHRRQFSGRWAWMLASGVLDIGLASIIIFDLPGTSAWTMGLLIGINMIIGGASLIAMGLHARSGSPASNAAFQ